MPDKKLKTTVIYLAVFAIASTTSVVWGQGQGSALPGASRLQSRDPLAMYRQAGISQDQENQLLSIRRNFEGLIEPKSRQLFNLMNDMNVLSLQADPDKQLVLAKQDEINKLSGEMSLYRMQYVLAMRKVLTAEQKQKYVQLLQQDMSSAQNK